MIVTHWGETLEWVEDQYGRREYKLDGRKLAGEILDVNIPAVEDTRRRGSIPFSCLLCPPCKELKVTMEVVG